MLLPERVGSLLPQHLALQRRRFDYIRSGLSTQLIFPVSFRKMLFPSPKRVHKAPSSAVAHSEHVPDVLSHLQPWLLLGSAALQYHSTVHSQQHCHLTSTLTELLGTGLDLLNAPTGTSASEVAHKEYAPGSAPIISSQDLTVHFDLLKMIEIITCSYSLCFVLLKPNIPPRTFWRS